MNGHKDDWTSENKYQYKQMNEGLVKKIDMTDINNRLKYNSFKMSNDTTN